MSEFVMGATLQLRDQASATFNKVQKSTEGFRKSMEQTSKTTGNYRDSMGRLRNEHGKFIPDVEKAAKATDKYKASADRLRGSMGALKKAIAAVASVAVIKKGFEWLVQGNADMETYKNTLAVVLKSTEKAGETLAWATKFAAKTPFEIPQIVEATTRMAAYGLSAKDTLGTIGDMASVMGKDLMQAVEAVADAQTGEMERLKEFSITKKMIQAQAKLMGNDPLNTKGQITDQQAFNAALFKLMETRYKGGMEMQSKTYKGMISNVKDFVGSVGRQLGQPIFEGMKSRLSGLLDRLNALQESGAVDRFVEKVHKAMSDVSVAFDNFKKSVSETYVIVKDFAVTAAGWIKDNWGKIEPLLYSVGGALAAYKAYSTYIWAIKAATTAWAVAQKAVTLAQAAFNVVMKASPVGIIITIIGALVGAFIYAYKNSEKFRNAVNNAFAKVSAFVVKAVATIKEVVTTAWNFILEYIWPVLQQIYNTVASTFTAIWNYLEPMLTAIWDTITSTFKAVWPVIQDVFNIIKGIIQRLWPVVQLIFTNIAMVIQRVFPVVVNFVKTWLTFLYNFWKTIFTAIWNVVTFVWAAIGPFITAALEVIRSVVVGTFNYIKAIIEGVMGAIQAVIETAWAIISGIWDTITAVLQGNWQAAWDNIVNMLSGVWDGIKNFFDSIGTMLFDCGKAVINTIVDGIKSVAMAPVNAVKDIFEKVREFLPFSDAKKGPLSNLTLNGKKIMTTISGGVEKGGKTLQKTVRNVFGMVRQYLPFSDAKKGPLSDLTLSGKRIITTLSAGVQKSGKFLPKAINKVFNKLDIPTVPQTFTFDGLFNGFDIPKVPQLFTTLQVATQFDKVIPPMYNGTSTISTNINQAQQSGIGTNFDIPTVPQLYTTLNVATQFDKAVTPTYSGTATIGATINPAGRPQSGGNSKVVKIDKLIEKIELKDVGNKDTETLVREIMDRLYEEISDADDIDSDGDMGGLL